MSSPLRQNVKYIAELFQSNQWSPTVAIAPNNFSRQNNIFSFSIAPLITDPSNYWITWGGYFDNVVGTGVQVYMDKFLTEVFIEENLTLVENSFYIDVANNICYMNIDKNPWQYFTAYASVYGNPLSTFSTAPKNEDNLSDIYYGGVRAIPRMEIPSLNNAISDAISGINVYNSFNINIDNRDGFFDGVDILNYFNTPLQISKTSTNAQSIDEFNQIRFGIVQDIKVDFKKIQITAVDQFYLMNKEYCRKFTTDEFPNISDSNLNENIPVGWGTLYGIEPIEVDKDTADPATWIDYIALDKSHITSVQGVFDKDGNSLTHSLNATTGVIRVTSVDGDGEVIEAEYMNVTGKTDCSIGEIIIEALAQNENIQYIEGIWDLTETDDYLSYCADIGFYFDGGTTKELIEGVLKNDIAFLIQKNNKLLTIRQWGKTYDEHYFESWLATQAPKKNFMDATKYYCSSAKVNYCKNWVNNGYDCNYLNDTSELELFGRWRKSYLAEFDTDLVAEADAIDLSYRIIERFGNVRETIEVGLGADTFEINLLDTVIFEPTINDREFSTWSQWIVKECDPGQDVIKMEGLEKFYPLTFDSQPAYIDGVQWIVSGDIR
jgi:hypothetical protein